MTPRGRGGQFDIADNLTPRVKNGQFDTKKVGRTIRHQVDGKEYLTLRTVYTNSLRNVLLIIFLGQTVVQRSNMFLCVGPVGPGLLIIQDSFQSEG